MKKSEPRLEVESQRLYFLCRQAGANHAQALLAVVRFVHLGEVPVEIRENRRPTPVALVKAIQPKR